MSRNINVESYTAIEERDTDKRGIKNSIRRALDRNREYLNSNQRVLDTGTV